MAHAHASALRHQSKASVPRFSAFLVIIPAALVVSGLLFSLPHLQAGGAGLSFLGFKKPAPSQKYVCPSASYTKDFTSVLKNGVPASSAQTVVETNARLLGQAEPSKDLIASRTDLTARKTALLGLMATAPDKALAAVLSPNIGDAYQTWTTNCVEERVTVTGKVTEYDYTAAKGIAPKGPDALFMLQTVSGSTLALQPAKALHTAFLTGDTLTITGFQLDDRIVFDGRSSVTVDPSGLGTGYTVAKEKTNRDAVTGPQETIVLLVNFQNTPQPAYPVSTIENIVFSQMNSYYQQNSYNKISIVGDVENWRTIPMDTTCDFASTIGPVVQAFDADVDFRQYERLVVFAPLGPSCPFIGISSVGQTTVATNDGPVVMSTSYILSNYAGVALTAHEYGHGLGLHHASFYNCPNTPYQETGCDITEYGSPYSTMGNHALFGYFNALEKDFLGWFVPSNIETVTESGTYTIDHLEVASTNLKALKFQRSANDFLYAEYRQPIGHDTGFGSTNAYDGALLHIRANTGVSGPQANRSFLLDAAHPPVWGSANDAALTVGQTFVDPLTNTSVKTVEKGDGDVDIQVQIGKHDFTAPQVSITSPAEGSTVSGQFTVTVDAQDASGIEKVVLQNGSLLFRSEIGTDTQAPFAFNVDSSMFPAGIATLVAVAYDKSGAPYGVANNSGSSGFFTVNIVGGDVTPPTTSMTAPLNNTAVRNLVTVSAQADDNGFISQLKLFVDGVQKFFQFGDASSISGVLDLTQGTHTAYSVAVDQAGLTTQSATSTFVVDNTAPTVSLVDPAQGASVSASIALTATAADNDAIQKVVFVRDSGTVIGEDPTAPYSVTWDTSLVPPGPHTLGAVAYDRAGNTATSSTHAITVQATATYVCGDSDSNQIVTISDAVHLINYIFSGGPAPSPLVAADADGSGVVTISDSVHLINYIFSGGPTPSCVTNPPSVKLAPDPTEGQTLQSFKAAHPEIFSQ
ncbi:MAG: Ig-like domain-containing protein [Patescibacteria group bacterium]|jgi:hypothetical protein